MTMVKRPMIACLLLALLMAAAAGLATRMQRDPVSAATCAEWSIAGTWQVTQGGYHPVFNLTQNGSDLKGEAVAPAVDAGRAGYKPGSPVTGSLTGSLNGDRFDVVVAWPPKPDGGVSRGRYQGTVVENGIIDGTTYDLSVGPGRTAAWTATGPARCLRWAPDAPVCTVQGDLKVSAQEIADIAKFRAQPGTSAEAANAAAAGDIAALARSRGGSGSVTCGSARVTVDAPPPAPTATAVVSPPSGPDRAANIAGCNAVLVDLAKARAGALYELQQALSGAEGLDPFEIGLSQADLQAAVNRIDELTKRAEQLKAAGQSCQAITVPEVSGPEYLPPSPQEERRRTCESKIASAQASRYTQQEELKYLQGRLEDALGVELASYERIVKDIEATEATIAQIDAQIARYEAALLAGQACEDAPS